VRRRGSGSFVLDAPVHPRVMTTLKSFADELSADGATVASRVVGQEEVASAPGVVLAKLGAAEGTELVRLARVRLVDGRPASFQEAWIPLALAPGLAREELVGGSLYRTLSERYGVALGWADQVISSSLVTAELAELLEEQVGNSLLVIERVTYSGRNQAVEYVRSWTRAQFPLQVRLEAG
jgi:GntR family transcriptional regulator